MLTRLASSLVAALLAVCTLPALAQNRITQAVTDTSRQREIPNTVHPRARAAKDLGAAPADAPLTSVTLRFNLTDAQNAALDQLLADQQNPASARYHQWLTPESYAAQFGLSPADLSTVTAYLQAQGLTVVSVSRSRGFVTVSGTVAQVQRAFNTEIHQVSLNGERHLANLSDPQLPAQIAAVVSTVTGLNDFRLRPHVRTRQVQPDYTSSVSGSHYIAPGDFYTIYDVNPLLTNNVNGTGVTIAIMGQTDISLPSVAAFRTASGLTANLPTVKLYGTDPGTSTNDLPEAQLDVEWAGAVAPAASILYVNSTDVIAGSLTQAIDNNIAPILSVSYGDCEANFGSTLAATYNQLFRQANVQGQTIVGPGGDSGATDCDYQTATAVAGLAVDFPASSPYVTGVGGTQFNEGSGNYFNTANAAFSGSAISYIPEAVWNESILDGVLGAGGGGASNLFTKPGWQIGTGVPSDFSRDVPDVSLLASLAHDPVLICAPGDCVNGYRNTGGYLDVIGGTSVATPSFAGVLALLEQKIQSRIGNANPVIYGLANSTYATAVYHDVTIGNNASPCQAGTPNCPNGGTIGYNAATGYDQASGWGSVDTYNFVSDWLLVSPAGTTGISGMNVSATTVTSTATSAVAGSPISLTATVTSATSGVTTVPTGTVQFLVDGNASGTAIPLSGGTATYALPTGTLSSGTHVVTVAYPGDTVYVGSKGTETIDILSATAGDFSLTPSAATVTATSGQNAPGVTFTVSSLNGFSGPVAFTATTASQNLSATYSFSVDPVNVTTTAAGTTVLQLSAYQAAAVTAGSGTPLARRNAGSAELTSPQMLQWKLAGSGVALAGLLCLFLPGRRRRMTGLLVALLSVGLLGVSGCGNGLTGSAPLNLNTQAGTYTITVTATGVNTSGTALSHNSTVTFVVH